MTVLFWLLWVFDLLLFAFMVHAIQFRGEMGASTGLQTALLIVLILALIGGPVLRFIFRLRLASLLAVGLPSIILLLMYLFDRARGV
jgi:hypothetical protein